MVLHKTHPTTMEGALVSAYKIHASRITLK
jgi:hypothetical protein